MAWCWLVCKASLSSSFWSLCNAAVKNCILMQIAYKVWISNIYLLRYCMPVFSTGKDTWIILQYHYYNNTDAFNASLVTPIAKHECWCWIPGVVIQYTFWHLLVKVYSFRVLLYSKILLHISILSPAQFWIWFGLLWKIAKADYIAYPNFNLP